MTVLKMFNQIGIGEHAGSGVPEVFDTWKNEGLSRPVVEEQFGADKPDRTIVTLPLEAIQSGGESGAASEKASEKASDNLTDARLEQILQAMKDGIEYKADEIAGMIGLKGTRTKELLRKLVKSNKIEAVGNTKGKRYIKR